MDSNAPSQTKPTTTTFSLDDHVQWKDHKGFVRFIDDRYITICIRTYPNPDPHAKQPNNEVCLLCYREYWHEVIQLDGK